MNNELETLAKTGLEKANQSEQYFHQNNIEIMNIKQEEAEDEATLLNKVSNLLDVHGIRQEMPYITSQERWEALGLCCPPG